MKPRLLSLAVVLLIGGALRSANPAGFANSSGLPSPDSLRWLSFRYVKGSDARLVSENGAWLHALPNLRISEARFLVNKSDGQFIDYFQSPDSYTLGGEAESFYRVTPRLVFHGWVSYHNFTGKQMGGSAFIDPNSTPFNMVESTDTTKGAKQQEVYRLTGSLAYDLSKRVTLGAKMDYTSTNYTKRKDLRHRNKLLNLVATAGMSYRLTPRIEVGINTFYRKRVEGVFFNTYGTTDRQYTSLVDFGTSYGRHELFVENGDGYTSGKKERPLTDTYHGGSLQLQLNLSPRYSFFNRFHYRHRNGYYGIPSSSEVTYTEHKGDEWGYLGSVVYKTAGNRHRIDLELESETLTNAENIYTIENEIGGFSFVEYHGENERLHRSQRKIGAEYSGYIDVKNGRPLWLVTAAASFNTRSDKTSLYPFFREQRLAYWRVNGRVSRSLANRSPHCLIPAVGLSFGRGSGSPFSDGLYATPSPTETAPPSADFNLYTQHHYITATRIGFHPALRYEIMLKSRATGSVTLHYDWVHALTGHPDKTGEQYTSGDRGTAGNRNKAGQRNKPNDRQQLLLSLGYQF